MTEAAASGAAAQADVNRCVEAHAEAQLLQRRGALVAQREQLLVCAQKGCPKPIAADCSGWLAEVEQSLPSLVLAVNDPLGADLVEVHVTANGAPIADKIDGRALTIDPGRYELRFEAQGYEPGLQSITVRQSEKNRIVRMQLQQRASTPRPVLTTESLNSSGTAPAALGAKPVSKPIPVTSYVLGGVAVVGLGMFTYFGLTELSDLKEKERLDQANQQRTQLGLAEQPCGSLCDRGKRDFVLTYVGLGVLVAGATGTVLAYVLSEPQRADTAHLRVTPLATSRAALLQVQGSF